MSKKIPKEILENIRWTSSSRRDGLLTKYGFIINLELKDEKETLDKLKRIAKQLKIMR